MNNRYSTMASPSPYVAETLDPRVGDLVSFMGNAYVVALVIDVAIPVYPDWPTGRYFALHLHGWSQAQHLIVPEMALDRARGLVA